MDCLAKGKDGVSLPWQAEISPQKGTVSPVHLRSDQLPPSLSVLGTSFLSPQISVLWVSSHPINMTSYFLSQRSSPFSGNSLGPGPFLQSQWAGPQMEAGPDPVSLSRLLHRPWNYSQRSRMPSSAASEGFLGWMRRPEKRPRTG